MTRFDWVMVLFRPLFSSFVKLNFIVRTFDKINFHTFVLGLVQQFPKERVSEIAFCPQQLFAAVLCLLFVFTTIVLQT